MKRRVLFPAVLFLSVCIVFPPALNCHCVTGDCGVPLQTFRGEVPQCHRGEASAKPEDASRKECCGQCRIDASAVLANELSVVSEVRPGSASPKIRSSVDFSSDLRLPSYVRVFLFEAPSAFFEEHVLNTTFSFRAPPRG